MKKNRMILYPPEEISFATHGLGVLSDALTCEVTEKINGEFELFMAYPIDGAMYSRLDYRHIVYAKPSPDRGPEPFRIYRISTPANGRVKVYARHLSYDTDGIPVSPFSATDTAGALTEIKRKTAVNNPFRIAADVNSAGEIKIKRPDSLRAVLMGQADSILSTYGGEYLFSGFHIRLCERRGSDHGYKIRYGVNLVDANQERNCASVYTGVYPYFYEETDGTETIVELETKIINLSGKFGFTRILPLDLSSEFSEIPTEEQLLKAAEAYIAEHDLGVPEVNITVEFALLRQYEEYKHLAFLESVELGDTVGVYFEKIGISAKARVISTVYDAILDRYSVIALGDEKQDIVSTLVTMENAVREATYKADNGMRTAARLTVRADALGAEIKALSEATGENGRNIADLTVRADANDAEIDAKVSKQDGSQTFGWNLSATKWQVHANGAPVFVVTKDGARVIGYIEAGSGKIGDFNITDGALTFGNVYIGKDITGFGIPASDVVGFDSDFATSISSDGALRSSKSYMYAPRIFGDVTFGGQPTMHKVNISIPLYINDKCVVGGYDISSHEARIQALERSSGGGGGYEPSPEPTYDRYLYVGYETSYQYHGVAPEVLIAGSGLTWYDDGGLIVVQATSTGNGTFTIQNNDSDIIDSWTYIIT